MHIPLRHNLPESSLPKELEQPRRGRRGPALPRDGRVERQRTRSARNTRADGRRGRLGQNPQRRQEPRHQVCMELRVARKVAQNVKERKNVRVHVRVGQHQEDIRPRRRQRRLHNQLPPERQHIPVLHHGLPVGSTARDKERRPDHRPTSQRPSGNALPVRQRRRPRPRVEVQNGQVGQPRSRTRNPRRLLRIILLRRLPVVKHPLGLSLVRRHRVVQVPPAKHTHVSVPNPERHVPAPRPRRSIRDPVPRPRRHVQDVRVPVRHTEVPSVDGNLALLRVKDRRERRTVPQRRAQALDGDGRRRTRLGQQLPALPVHHPHRPHVVVLHPITEPSKQVQPRVLGKQDVRGPRGERAGGRELGPRLAPRVKHVEERGRRVGQRQPSVDKQVGTYPRRPMPPPPRRRAVGRLDHLPRLGDHVKRPEHVGPCLGPFAHLFHLSSKQVDLGPKHRCRSTHHRPRRIPSHRQRENRARRTLSLTAISITVLVGGTLFFFSSLL